MTKIAVGPGRVAGGAGGGALGNNEPAPEANGPRPGLHMRLRAINDLTPRRILRAPFTLPVVTGDELTIDEEALWEEFDTVSAGRFAQASAGAHAHMLQTFTVNGMTLYWSPKWLTAPHQDIGDVLDELRSVLRARAIFDLLLVNKPQSEFAEFSGFAFMKNLSIVLKKGEPDTRYLQMDLSSYRRMSSRRRRHGKAANLPTTATLSADDTLRSLAKHFYGSGAEWRLIASANGIEHWGSEDPLVKLGRYKVGSKLKIPQRPQESAVKVGNAIDLGGGATQAIEVGG